MMATNSALASMLLAKLGADFTFEIRLSVAVVMKRHVIGVGLS